MRQTTLKSECSRVSNCPFCQENALLWPKTSVQDKFNDIHFLADANKLVRSLRENGTSSKTFCEIESATNWQAKNVRETPKYRGLVKANEQ